MLLWWTLLKTFTYTYNYPHRPDRWKLSLFTRGCAGYSASLSQLQMFPFYVALVRWGWPATSPLPLPAGPRLGSPAGGAAGELAIWSGEKGPGPRGRLTVPVSKALYPSSGGWLQSPRLSLSRRRGQPDALRYHRQLTSVLPQRLGSLLSGLPFKLLILTPPLPWVPRPPGQTTAASYTYNLLPQCSSLAFLVSNT